MKIMANLISAIQRAQDGRFRLGIALILGVGAFGWGLSILLVPQAMYLSPAFRVSVLWAAPEVWGVMMAGLGVVLVSTVFSDMRLVVWPSSALAFLYIGLTISIALGAHVDYAVPTAIWAYLTLGSVASALALATAPRKGEG